MKKTIQKALATLMTAAMLIPLSANAAPNPYRIRLDVNNDRAINAIDASIVLAEYAATSTKQPSSFTITEKYLADSNYDGAINAVDASAILEVYAYNATSDTPMFEQKVTYSVRRKYEDRLESNMYDNYEDCLAWIIENKASYEKKWEEEKTWREHGFTYEITRYHQDEEKHSSSVRIYIEDEYGEIILSPK